MEVLSIKELSVVKKDRLRGKREVLKTVNLSLDRGEWVVVCGEEFSGVTELLQTVAGGVGNRNRVREGNVEYSPSMNLGVVDPMGERFHYSALSVREYCEAHLEGNRGQAVPDEDWEPLFFEVGLLEPERLLSESLGSVSELDFVRLSFLKCLLSGSDFLIAHDPTR
ncbi:MAG: hypothetical protein AAF226_10700, partial [Verrucomicrobiota bacterium]